MFEREASRLEGARWATPVPNRSVSYSYDAVFRFIRTPLEAGWHLGWCPLLGSSRCVRRPGRVGHAAPLIVLRINPGVGLIHHFGQEQQVITAETLGGFPMITFHKQSLAGGMVTPSRLRFIFPAGSWDATKPDFTGRFDSVFLLDWLIAQPWFGRLRLLKPGKLLVRFSASQMTVLVEGTFAASKLVFATVPSETSLDNDLGNGAGQTASGNQVERRQAKTPLGPGVERRGVCRAGRYLLFDCARVVALAWFSRVAGGGIWGRFRSMAAGPNRTVQVQRKYAGSRRAPQ